MKKCTLPAPVATMALMFLFVPWLTARAYEEKTHATITDHAFQAALTQGDLGNRLSDLGISANTVLSDTSESLPPDAWVRKGSIREDDGTRPLNHFYDPTHSPSGLCGWGSPSPVWGISGQGIFLTGYTNKFSLKAGRQYLFNALTLPSASERDSNLAKTFQALGQVMHLIQDMASPQHVRDDAHNPTGWIQGLANSKGCATSSASYEKYIEKMSSSFNYDGYPLPEFPNAQSFWGWGMGQNTGLAEFTNENFVSEGTNFNGFPLLAGSHPLPALDISRKFDMPMSELYPGTRLTGSVTFFRNIPGALGDFRLTAYSLFDRDLAQIGRKPIFALNKGNFEDYARLLLPRAVGYSAGLLNYFFRGSLDAQLDAGGSVIIHNTSREAMDGEFALYHDDANDDRSRIPISGASKCQTTDGPSNCLTIDAGHFGTLGTFTWPTSPREPGKFILVFRGKLGAEDDAIVGKVVDFTPILFAPNDSFIGDGSWEPFGNGPYGNFGPTMIVTENYYTVDRYGIITHQHYSGNDAQGYTYAFDIRNITAFDNNGRLIGRTLEISGIPCGYSRLITETLSYSTDSNGSTNFTKKGTVTVGCPESPSPELTSSGTEEVSAYNNKLPSPTGSCPAGTYIWNGATWTGP